MSDRTLRVVILDSEGLAGVGRNDRVVAHRLAAARDNGQRVILPAVVAAEVITGGPTDVGVYRAMKRLIAEPISVDLAARAGQLRERAGRARRKKRDLTVDAIVAAVAIARAPSVVLTADPDDLQLLTEGHDVRVIGL
ncbi:PIN domain-containing protein [Nocardioides humi]|uniref:PIN domain-containing protein n=1 Tax=Nocardioides humi TaxID=449461 RepID=A0ABN2AWR5_9ACTN|nr:PIN domain-containing protein [Nocardioides humi]